MTNKELKKYFEKRPSVDTLYVVGGIVFTEPGVALGYASQFGQVCEVHNRGDEDKPESVKMETGETETGEMETGEQEIEAPVTVEPVTAEPVTAEPVIAEPVVNKSNRKRS